MDGEPTKALDGNPPNLNTGTDPNGKVSAATSDVIIDARTGHVDATVLGVGAGDEVWFNSLATATTTAVAARSARCLRQRQWGLLRPVKDGRLIQLSTSPLLQVT